MKKEIKNAIETSLEMPITEEGAKKVLGGFYRALSNSSNKKEQKLGKNGIKNLDVLAKGLVKTSCQRILDEEQMDR